MKTLINSKVYGNLEIDISAFQAKFKEIFLSNKIFLYYDFEHADGTPLGLNKKFSVTTQCSYALSSLKNFKILSSNNLLLNTTTKDSIKTFYKKIINSLYFRIIKEKCIGIVYEKSAEQKWLWQMGRKLGLKEFRTKVNTIINKTYDLKTFFDKSEYSLHIQKLKNKISIKTISKEYQNNQCPLKVMTNISFESGKEVNKVWSLLLNNNANLSLWMEKYKSSLKQYCANDVLAMIAQVLNLKEFYEELKILKTT